LGATFTEKEIPADMQDKAKNGALKLVEMAVEMEDASDGRLS
jgi:hypothetical protein